MPNQVGHELFINDVDTNTRENIIKLDQKLRGLRAEIESKINSDLLRQNSPKEEYTNRLPTLLNEIDLAIKGIEHLVNIVVPEDEALKHSFFESEEMRQFKDVLQAHLEKLTKLKNEF